MITMTTAGQLWVDITTDEPVVEVLDPGTATLDLTPGLRTVTFTASSLDELHRLVVDIDHAITRTRNELAERGSDNR